MSWNLFKSRRSIPTSATEKNIAKECTRIQHVEDGSKKLLKEGKKLADATLILGKSGAKIGCDLKVISEHIEKCPCAGVLDSAMENEHKLSLQKNILLQKTVIDPMTRYSTAFPHLNAHMKSHDKAQQEYKKLQAKMDKLREKGDTGPNMVKMQNVKKELVPAKEEFESKHNMLLDEFPTFYNSRLQYLQPIFESLVMSECWHHHELFELFEESFSDFSLSESETSLDDEIKHTLEEIRALAITSD